MSHPDSHGGQSEANNPIPEENQEIREIVETDELMDFREFEDEEYLGDVEASAGDGSFAGESE